jgi:hypothetical protein
LSLLRDSFAGINARFHLAGLYTLIDLLLLILLAVAGDNTEWGGAVLAGLALAWGGTVAILGLVFHAASGQTTRPPLPTLVALLFLPLLWLQIRLRLIVYLPFLFGALGWHALIVPSETLQAWLPRAVFFCAPPAEVVVSLLALFSTPITILRRERGTRGAPIREGVRLMLAEPRASARLLAVLVPAAVLGSVVHYLRGPESKDPVPSAPEGLAFFVTSYLTLVALYGACRVVLDRAGGAGGRDRTTGPAAAAPGPPA